MTALPLERSNMLVGLLMVSDALLFVQSAPPLTFRSVVVAPLMLIVPPVMAKWTLAPVLL